MTTHMSHQGLPLLRDSHQSGSCFGQRLQLLCNDSQRLNLRGELRDGGGQSAMFRLDLKQSHQIVIVVVQRADFRVARFFLFGQPEGPRSGDACRRP